jgi:hypothetical protein
MRTKKLQIFFQRNYSDICLCINSRAKESEILHGFEVLTAVVMKSCIFWAITSVAS